MSPGVNGIQNHGATEVFRNEFDGYQKMAASDYLEHSLLFKNVQACLEQQGKPLRILDLGCGDAANFARTLAQIPGSIASYTGVDMSDSALQSAHANLRQALGPAFPLFLHTNDILSYLKTLYGAYDVVLAAFALHHLTSEDKLEAMKEIKRVLAQDGVFIMVDPFRKEGESLAAYRQRATDVGGTWVDMGSEQQATFIKHMQDYDIVEEEAFFDIAVEQAGFLKKEIVCAGKKGLQSNVVVFRQ